MGYMVGVGVVNLAVVGPGWENILDPEFAVSTERRKLF